MIKQSKLPRIKSEILSNLFHENYGLNFGEFNNTTGTERVKLDYNYVVRQIKEEPLTSHNVCVSILVFVDWIQAVYPGKLHFRLYHLQYNMHY